MIAVDRHSGKLLWKRPVGIHNGHDNDSLYAMKHEYSKLEAPGDRLSGAAGRRDRADGDERLDGLRPGRQPPGDVHLTDRRHQEGPSESGELVALKVATGAVEWKHEFSRAALRGRDRRQRSRVRHHLSGELVALAANSGAVVWEIAAPGGHQHRRDRRRRHAARARRPAGADGPDTRVGRFRLGG